MARISARQGNAAAAFDRNFNRTGQVNFRGAGRPAAYRGAATQVLRAGGGAIAAHRAGQAAQQAYAG